MLCVRTWPGPGHMAAAREALVPGAAPRQRPGGARPRVVPGPRPARQSSPASSHGRGPRGARPWRRPTAAAGGRSSPDVSEGRGPRGVRPRCRPRAGAGHPARRRSATRQEWARATTRQKLTRVRLPLRRVMKHCRLLPGAVWHLLTSLRTGIRPQVARRSYMVPIGHAHDAGRAGAAAAVASMACCPSGSCSRQRHARRAGLGCGYA